MLTTEQINSTEPTVAWFAYRRRSGAKYWEREEYAANTEDGIRQYVRERKRQGYEAHNGYVWKIAEETVTRRTQDA